jgi:predicted ATP-grasp superfamily ATP-dependent carboligase
MRMARVNVYLPDDLASDARGAGLNVSALTQDAVRQEMAARRTDAWLEQVMEMKGPEVDVSVILSSVHEALEDLERGRE